MSYLAADGANPLELFGYLDGRVHDVLDLVWTHAWLSVVPVIIGLVLALPLGYLAHRYRWAFLPMVSVSGLLYTIPSIALFVVMPGILGIQILNPLNVVVALSVYSVALLVRVVADGLASVPPEIEQAATAMGYTRFQRLRKVDLPLAVPVIAAGLRVATVSNVSMVAIAGVIGVANLGQLFVTGLQLSYFPPTYLGILACVVLAVLFDLAIVLGNRWLTPWRRAVAAR